MKKMGLNEIREVFLRYFEENGHLRLDSAPLIPQGDASLLFINSGMAPLKPYFSGETEPPRRRATSCQKCIRTPDIERVGKTSRHGTFFEMLGNFSFGDYFKREAIQWAWSFCTDVMEIPVDLLHVSVYLDDDEAYDIWTKEVGVDPSHMVRLGKADNFWEIGTGPCGPCSEIYFDRGAQYSCGSPDCAVGCDCDRYVEFWNLVFTQYHSDGAGNYAPLAQKNIDTGMGLERLACMSQGVDNLFEVDTIRRVIDHVCRIAGVTYKKNEKTDVSIRVITDHIRSTTMLIGDGALPSNEGRGYVLRRLLRRAARHGKLLGINRLFLAELCETVIEESGQAYPNLLAKKEHIRAVISMEEERFNRTCDAGLLLLNETIAAVKAARKDILSGDDAFKLYDTFGFPVDLTLEILEESGLKLDMEAYESNMRSQRERARAARGSMEDAGWAGSELKLSGDKTVFTGYDMSEDEGKVLALLADGALCNAAEEGQAVVIVLDRTPFYAESGGQTYDVGVMTSKGAVVDISAVHKTKEGHVLHSGVMRSGALATGDAVRAVPDIERRRAVMRAHSATHLLHAALRRVLGEHVEQAGSLVEPDRLRFDFSHLAAMSADELLRVERLVNEMIMSDADILVREMPIAEARAQGAMALFGEKYGDTVRVVSMGDVSIELCGGTHLKHTSQAGLFAIRSEASVAAGVRRIEAETGFAVLDEVTEMKQRLYAVSDALKTTPQELRNRAVQVLSELKDMHAQVEKLRSGQLGVLAGELLADAIDVDGLRVATAKVDLSADAMRTLGDKMRDLSDHALAVLASAAGDKITFLAVAGKEAVARGLRAGDVIKEVTRLTGGSGGGKPDSAMGGGKDVALLEDALLSVADWVRKSLGK